MSNSTPAPATAAAAVNVADAIKAIDALLQPLNRSDAPGLIIGINQHGRSLYRRGFGLASIEHGVANTPRTRMRIASTSKHFTALAIMLLAEDGKLDINDPVHKHLPELPALPPLGDRGPTLRQLLNHTSGWRGHDEMWALSNGLALQEAGTSLAAMARQSELNSEPGARLIYSNGTYHMLALIVARLSGMSYAEFLRARIFEPLGMLDSESVANDLEVRPGLATLYLPAFGPKGPTGGWKRGIYPCEIEGGGSIASTLDDMLVWLAHLRSTAKTVGSASSWAQMLEPTTLNSGEVVPYGFGLAHHHYRGVEVIHHNGAVLGGSSQMITVPAHGLDIMIMANGAPVAPAQIAFKVIELLLADKLTEPAVPRAALSAHPGLVGQRYHAPESGNVIGFAAAGDRLAMSWLGSAAVPLRECENGLWLDFLDVGINPMTVELEGVDTSNPAQPPETLTLREGGILQRMQRMPTEAPAVAPLAPQLCGAYHSPDLDASAQIELRGEELLLLVQGHHGQLKARLRPLSDAVLSISSTDPVLAALGASSLLNIERDGGGQVVGLRYDGMRTRRLRFLRQGQAA